MRIPAIVLVATVSFGALSALWSVVVPLLEAPDEPDHLALVLVLADGRPYPAYDGLMSPLSVYRTCYEYAASIRACPRTDEIVTPTGTRRHPRQQAPPKVLRPTWKDRNGAAPVGALNQMPQHPPLYYELMAGVLRVERRIRGGPWSLDREIALLRLANALLVMPLPLLAWWAARRFGLDQTTSIAASFAMFGVPMLTHIGSTLNNDNLLTVCGAVVIALLAGVLRGDRSLKTGALLGVAIGVALLTKAFAAVFPPLAILAYLIGARSTWPGAATTDGAEARHGLDDASADAVDDDLFVPDTVPCTTRSWRESLLAIIAPLGLAGLVTVVLSAWWYLGVHSRTGSFTPTVEDAALTSDLQTKGFTPHVGGWIGDFIANVNTRFWGSFGWFAVSFTGPLAVALSVIVVLAVGSALATRRTPGAVGRSPGRLARLWLLTPTAALTVLVAGRSWNIYATTSKLIFAQGRYLFAGIVGLALLVAIGARRAFGRRTPFVLIGAAGLLQLHALRRCLTVFWGLPGLGPRGQTKAMVAYSGWPGSMVAAIAVVALLCGLAMAGGLVHLGLHDPDATEAVPVGSDAP